MDKLKPILNHSYWIVFVAAIILPTAGWWMASGEIDAATEKAEEAADGAFSSVPDSNSPNHTYGEAVQAFNATLAAENKRFNAYLWVTQSDSRLWPESIKNDMEKIPYLGEIGINIRRLYRKDYFPQLNDVPKIVDAFPENPVGKVSFDLTRFSPQVSRADWNTEPPESKTMWEVQEDLWLLRALLSAVAETNRGYDNILQAPVKEIESIVLRGGSANTAAAGAGGAPGEAAAAPEAAGDPAGPAQGLLGPGLGRGLIGANGGSSGSQLNLDEIFGSDADTSAGGAAVNPGADGPVAAEAGPGALGGFGQGLRGRNGKKVRRYVDDEKDAPFKTRGFYIELVMEHTKLSDLMVHLANLDWPVEILRVQQQMANPDQFANVNGGAAGARPGGMGARRTGLGRRNLRSRGFGGRPMPAAEPMGSMDPTGGLGPGAAGDAKKAADGARMYQAGMKKPTLAFVSIAGKFTIFQPPPKDDAATLAANAQQGTPAGDAATAEPPADTAELTGGTGTTPNTKTTGETTPPANTTPAVDPNGKTGAAPADVAKPPAPADTPTPTPTPSGNGQPEASSTKPKQP